jgi:hypothetical protein
MGYGLFNTIIWLKAQSKNCLKLTFLKFEISFNYKSEKNLFLYPKYVISVFLIFVLKEDSRTTAYL